MTCTPWLLSMEMVCTVPEHWSLHESQSTYVRVGVRVRVRVRVGVRVRVRVRVASQSTSSTPEMTSAKTTWHFLQPSSAIELILSLTKMTELTHL